MKDVVVGVTALTMVDSPQPGFGVARSLKEKGYKVIGINGQDLTAAMCLPYFDSVKVMDSLLEKNKKQFLQDLKKIRDSTGMEVLIPCFDTDVLFCSQLKKRIERIGIKLLVPSVESYKRSAKDRLFELSDRVDMPPTAVVKNKKELEEKAKEIGWPMVCKGVVKDAYIAKNMEMTKLYCDQIKEWWEGGRGKVILQKFIMGDFYAVCGVSNRGSELVSYIQMKKLGIDLKGATWSGASVFGKKLHDTTLRIIEELGWTGPFEFEFIKENGKYKLFEINPRLSGWVYLATAAGENIPDAIARTVLGEGVPFTAGSYKRNMAFTRIAEEVVFPRKHIDELYKLGKPAKN